MAQHGTAWHSMAQHGTAWHSTSPFMSSSAILVQSRNQLPTVAQSLSVEHKDENRHLFDLLCLLDLLCVDLETLEPMAASCSQHSVYKRAGPPVFSMSLYCTAWRMLARWEPLHICRTVHCGFDFDFRNILWFIMLWLQWGLLTFWLSWSASKAGHGGKPPEFAAGGPGGLKMNWQTNKYNEI